LPKPDTHEPCIVHQVQFGNPPSSQCINTKRPTCRDASSFRMMAAASWAAGKAWLQHPSCALSCMWRADSVPCCSGTSVPAPTNATLDWRGARLLGRPSLGLGESGSRPVWEVLAWLPSPAARQATCQGLLGWARSWHLELRGTGKGSG
jgi:hypothetical protein